jgi:hypothetical protein
MTPSDDIYEAWMRKRSDVSVAADFADRVMAALRRDRRVSRLMRVGLCSMAVAVCVWRVAQAVLLFLTHGEGM